MKKTDALGDGEGDEGDEEFLPFGRPTDDQSTRRDTSDAAYRKARLTSQREAMLTVIRERPRTCDEIEATGWPHQSASAAINWLMRKGHISDSGIRRKTSMGRDAIVWIANTIPIPVPRTRPTRKELEERINATIEMINRGAHGGVTMEQIIASLRGQA